MTVGSKTQEDRFGVIAEAVFAQVRAGFRQTSNAISHWTVRLDEIGLDSLARMEVLNRLEEAFGLRFSEDSLYDMATCRDMVEYVEANAELREFALEARCNGCRPSPPAVSRSESNPC